MSAEESQSRGGASVGSSDRSGGNNVGVESRGGASVGSSDISGGNNVGEESRGGASVGRSDISGGNNMSEECSDVIESDDCSIDIDDQSLSEEEKRRFASLEKVKVELLHNAGHDKPKIQHVPSILRVNTNLNKYFKPKVFSFGPYNNIHKDDKHHKDLNFKTAKKIKLKLAVMFLLKQKAVIKEALYADIKKEIKNLRDCYDDEAKDYQDQELAWMFLVDGCTILQFIDISVDYWSNPEKQLRKLGIKTDYAAFLEQDLFLLDNQLPYPLLQLIIQHTKKKSLLEYSIYKFCFYYIRPRSHQYFGMGVEWLTWWYGIDRKIFEENHVHLLDLLRKVILIKPRDQINKKPNLVEITIGFTVDLFDKLRGNKELSYLGCVPVRNIGELRAAGINLKSSETSCVTDITFSGSTLKLPPIFLEESKASTFLNMAAYEMCSDFHNGFEVSSYLYFMDKLIDRAQDVEELREKNILHNAFGSDDEVAKLFNEIGIYLFPNDRIYSEVKRDIDNYFHNIWLLRLRKIIHDIHQHFKSRWSMLAFFGAILVLASSIIQTVYTGLGYYAGLKNGN